MLGKNVILSPTWGFVSCSGPGEDSDKYWGRNIGMRPFDPSIFPSENGILLDPPWEYLWVLGKSLKWHGLLSCTLNHTHIHAQSHWCPPHSQTQTNIPPESIYNWKNTLVLHNSFLLVSHALGLRTYMTSEGTVFKSIYYICDHDFSLICHDRCVSFKEINQIKSKRPYCPKLSISNDQNEFLRSHLCAHGMLNLGSLALYDN